MSHADAWACVALDLLQAWRLLPILFLILGVSIVSSKEQGPDDQTLGFFIALIGAGWLIAVIGLQAGWFK